MDKRIMIAGGVGLVGIVGYYAYHHFSSGSSAPSDSVYTDTSAYGAMPAQYSSSGGSGSGSGSNDTTAPQVQILPSGSASNSDDGFGAFMTALLAGQNDSQQMKASDLVSVINAQGNQNLMSQVANNLPWGGSLNLTGNGFTIDNSPGIYVNDQNNSTFLLSGLINALGGTGGTGAFGTDGHGGGNIVITKPTVTTGTIPPSISGGKTQNQLIIDSFYKSIGNTHPDSEGQAYWAGQLSSGKTVDQVQTAFFNSAATVKNAPTIGVYNGPVSTGTNGATQQGQAQQAYQTTASQQAIMNYFTGPTTVDTGHGVVAHK